MLQSKEDITTGLLATTAQVHPAAGLDLASRALQSKDVQQYHISLFGKPPFWDPSPVMNSGAKSPLVS